MGKSADLPICKFVNGCFAPKLGFSPHKGDRILIAFTLIADPAAMSFLFANLVAAETICEYSYPFYTPLLP